MTKTLLVCLVGTVWAVTLLHGCQTAPSRMSPGEIMYRGKCASCHNLIAPARFAIEEWKTYVDRYGKKLTAGEKQMLLDYLAGSEQANRSNGPFR